MTAQTIPSTDELTNLFNMVSEKDEEPCWEDNCDLQAVYVETTQCGNKIFLCLAHGDEEIAYLVSHGAHIYRCTVNGWTGPISGHFKVEPKR